MAAVPVIAFRRADQRTAALSLSSLSKSINSPVIEIASGCVVSFKMWFLCNVIKGLNKKMSAAPQGPAHRKFNTVTRALARAL
jgi:hypothetical protein